MGMFDTIFCEHELPLPKEAGELKNPPDWKKWEFQTKSVVSQDESMFLGGFGETYTIEEDGQLYKEVVERELKEDENGKPEIVERNEGIEKQFYTGEMLFYNAHMEEKYDYWIEFLALFWKGDLKEISLSKWEKNANSDRLRMQDELKEAVDKAFKKKKPSVLRKPVRFFCFLFRWALGALVKLTWRLERWLS